MEKENRYFIKSLAKGLSLLSRFAEASGPLTLSEISRIMRMNITTVKRLCNTLEQLGYLERDHHKRYQLTPRVLGLGYAYIAAMPWRETAKYYLQQLFDEVEETVNLSVLEGRNILYVIRIPKEEYLPIDIRIGTKLPVFCTAMGKALLAFRTPSEIDDILKLIQFKPLTIHTITDRDRFRQELESVRELGYAMADEELSLGNRAISAPVLDKNGGSVAAINIAFPSTSFDRLDMERTLAPLLIRKAHELSLALQQMESPVMIEPGA